MWIELGKAFLVGGILCALGQILIDRTSLTPARILTGYVVAGVILGALGIYPPLIEWAGAGATVPLTGFGSAPVSYTHLTLPTVPLTGFGSALAKGVREAVEEKGLLGAFTGGFTASAGGIAAAVFFGYLTAILFKPKEKK